LAWRPSRVWRKYRLALRPCTHRAIEIARRKKSGGQLALVLGLNEGPCSRAPTESTLFAYRADHAELEKNHDIVLKRRMHGDQPWAASASLPMLLFNPPSERLILHGGSSGAHGSAPKPLTFPCQQLEKLFPLLKFDTHAA